MTSVVRIKRRASQEPTEALLLATKRVRVDESGTPSQVNAGETNVFKFCGSSQNEVIFPIMNFNTSFSPD